MVPALRILLAEDNPGDVFLVREALNKHCKEYDLTVAPDGQSAWKLIEAAEGDPRERFTFFLLDLNLPIRPGIELVTRIRRSTTDLSQSIVVMMTSSSAVYDQCAALDAGADYYFCKPSNYEEFMQLGDLVRTLWAAHVDSNFSS